MCNTVSLLWEINVTEKEGYQGYTFGSPLPDIAAPAGFRITSDSARVFWRRLAISKHVEWGVHLSLFLGHWYPLSLANAFLHIAAESDPINSTERQIHFNAMNTTW
jgi:hypothetical protein